MVAKLCKNILAKNEIKKADFNFMRHVKPVRALAFSNIYK